MMQHPMVQELFRNDPRFANNPEMRGTIEQMFQNPAMLNQLSQMVGSVNNQMMQNPEMQQEMTRNMMNAMRAGSGPPQPSSSGNGGSNATQTEQEMTEEEMIAEAIRRSLEE